MPEMYNAEECGTSLHEQGELFHTACSVSTTRYHLSLFSYITAAQVL